jgi:ubiquinol-cytochrome c reductase cytochrome c1 subunit
MVRLIGILTGLFFTVAVLWAFATGAYTAATEGLGEKTAESEFHEHPREVDFTHDGAFGHFDRQQLQRGYQVYKEVCSACHSLRLVAFRNLSELGYTEAEVKAEAASWQVPGIDPNTGEATTRPGAATDYFPKPFANDVAAAAANGNAIPPDLSLMAKARHDGPAYIYSLLVGYTDPANHKNDAGQTLAQTFPDSMPGTGLYFNPYFPNLNLAMAPPLTSDGQVTYADGTDASIDQMAKDVSAFLAWTAEPTLEKRKQTGWPVVGFLLFATILAFFAKKQIWAAVTPKRKD